MRTVLILLLAIAATGCATDAHHSGRQLSFDCSGAGDGWDACAKQADAQCGAKGYDVVKRKIDSVTGASGTSEMKRELIVACK